MRTAGLIVKSITQQLEKDGYVIIPGVLTEQEVLSIHQEATGLMETTHDATLTPTEFLLLPHAREVLFKPSVVKPLLNLFVDPYCMYPNFTIRNNLYIQWHTDDFYLNDPLEHHILDMPEFIMCNVYLQDNSQITGGGIDVVPGSHHFGKLEKNKLIDRKEFDYLTVGSKKGDLLLFDYRIIHRGTPPIQETYPNRLAVQWTISRSNQHANKLLEYLLRRRHEKLHLSDHTKKRATRYFSDIPNIQYPDSFPTAYLAAMEYYNVQIICADFSREKNA